MKSIIRNLADDPRLLLLVRLLIGGLFIYSGGSKLVQPIEYFEVAIRLYDIVPDALAPAASNIVPWIELLFGTYLVLGYWLQNSAGILAGLTGLFQIVLAQAILRKVPIDECGCFGGGLIKLSLQQSFILDTVLVLLLIHLASSHVSIFSLDNKFLNKDKLS